jgi:hypothetical protein
VVCAHDGTWRLTTSRLPGAPTRWSELWDELLGAVADGRESLGIDTDFRAGLESGLRPGTSALLVVVAALARDRLLDALSPFEGDLLVCRTPAELLHGGPPNRRTH